MPDASTGISGVKDENETPPYVPKLIAPASPCPTAPPFLSELAFGLPCPSACLSACPSACLSACRLTGDPPLDCLPFDKPDTPEPCFSGEPDTVLDLAALVRALDADLPLLGEVASAGAEGRFWECPSWAEPAGRLFQGLSDRWKGRCLVGLRRLGDLELERGIDIGAPPPKLLPVACCS